MEEETQITSADPGAAKASLWMARIPAIAFIALLLFAVAACREEQKVDVGNLDSGKLPTMKTTNVNTLISDSGIVQYRIVSPLWLMYENVDSPYWHFPKGLYLRRFDRFQNIIATVAADSAKYFKNQRLWRLDGRVEITRAPSDLFQTEQLFWNERTHMLYTDKFMHIENATHMLEGDGFRSDDQLRQYTVIHPKGIFPLNNPASAATAGGLGATVVATTSAASSASTHHGANAPADAQHNSTIRQTDMN